MLQLKEIVDAVDKVKDNMSDKAVGK